MCVIWRSAVEGAITSLAAISFGGPPACEQSQDLALHRTQHVVDRVDHRGLHVARGGNRLLKREALTGRPGFRVLHRAQRPPRGGETAPHHSPNTPGFEDDGSRSRSQTTDHLREEFLMYDAIVIGARCAGAPTAM